MTVEEAQREGRRIFRNGAVGQIVAAVVWLSSAALGTWGTQRQAILALVIGGFFIFPVTQLLLWLSGRPSKLSPENPLGYLAMQVAFIVPFMLPVAGWAAL